MRSLIALGIGLVFIAIAALSTSYSIDEGELGIVLHNGAFQSVAAPGRHFKLPIVDSVVEVSTRAQNLPISDVLSYSSDQQQASVFLSVNFSIDPSKVDQLYSRYGSVDNFVIQVMKPQMLTTFKTIFGQTSAMDSTTKQDVLLTRFKADLDANVNDTAIINTVQIENVDFSDKFEQNVEDRASAEVAVKTEEQNLAKERVLKQISVTKAQALADSSLAQATADALSTKLRGDAEAEAITAKGKALRDNPSVIDLVRAQTWNGVLPTTMVPGSAVPFINVN